MLGKTYLAGDAELGKKYDDYWQRTTSAPHIGWPDTWGAGGGSRWRWRRRRILLLFVVVGIVGGVLLVWGRSGAWGRRGETVGGRIGLEGGLREAAMYGGQAYVRPTDAKAIHDKSTHDDDEGDVDDDEKANHESNNSNSHYEDSIYDDDMDGKEPTGPPPGVDHPHDGEATPHTYSGPIRFFRLAHTLRAAASRTAGYNERNRNVMFVMASLQSAAALLPMICDMSKWNRNYVHAAFMGRQDMALDDVLAINGIDKEECSAVWHDARPNYMEYSDDDRAERAVIAAMTHIHSFLHPQAVIMADALSELGPFVRGIRSKTMLLNMPLIEVPKDRLENVGYLTRLDSSSLKNWHTPTVDIVIQVPPDSSSILGLLKSIRDADYNGLAHPRITLDLPSNLDVSVKQHIESFTWPPHSDKTTKPAGPNGLVVRRRIAGRDATHEDAAMRFLELFYPANSDSHVLLLTPQAQLAPQYFQFIKYALLEHCYSAYGKDENEALMGISLNLPATLLDGRTPLTLPRLRDMHTARYARDYPGTASVPFLWQAPDFAATLLWGDKWVEWHDFVGNRLRKIEQQGRGTANASKRGQGREGRSGWMGYMEEFMRARGYAMLYPASRDKSLVTVHEELHLDRGPRSRASSRMERTLLPASMALHHALPFSGDLPEIQYLPFRLANGTLTPHDDAADAAKAYADTFRREVGGCEAREGMRRRVVKGETRDLFCFEDEEIGAWVGDEEEGGVEGLRTELEMAELEGLLGGDGEKKAGTGSSGL